MAKKDETPAPKAKRPDVLILVHRMGPYTVYHNEPGGAPVGGGHAGKKDGVRGMKRTEVSVWPGANLRPAADFDLVKGNTGFLGRQTIGEIEVVVADDDEPCGGWLTLNKPTRLKMADVTSCPKTLPLLAEIETDEEVAAALEKQIAASKGPPPRQGKRGR